MRFDPDDFSAEAFVARIRPHLVEDARLLPSIAPFGDATLDPSLAPAVAARGLREAAVLVGIVTHPREAGVILTQRTEHLSQHAGQVAFPGGKIDREDAGPISTALREAEEEIGLAPADVVPIGCFPPYASNSGFRIVPVVGLVRPGAPVTPNPHEVADVFEVPLGFLMSGDNHRVASRMWQGRRRWFYEMPFGDRYIWGVTAGILRQIFERTWGRGAPPAPGTPDAARRSEELS
jgi:8-oxo-dGTP pyrophosphatase MutT (NUDIX family)